VKTQEPNGRDERRELLVLALPMIASQACEALMMVTDRIFLSWQGAEAMSAAMAAGVTCFLFCTFFVGLISFGNALVAQHLGAGQRDRCALVGAQLLMVALAGGPILLCSLPIGRAMFAAAHIDPFQERLQNDYFFIVTCGAVLTLLRSAFASYFSGIGRTRVVLVASAAALLTNALVAYVLILGHFGFPALGVRGAAIGTLAGAGAAAAVLGATYFGAENAREFGVWSSLRLHLPTLRQLLKLGAPSGLEMLLNVLAFEVLLLSFHSYGAAAAGAATITFSWDMVSFVPLMGLGIGLTSLVGRHMGAGSPELAARAAKAGMQVAGAYVAVTFCVYFSLAEPLVGVFLRPETTAHLPEMRALAVFMVRTMSLYVFADAMSIIFGSVLRGAGDTLVTMFLNVTGHWLFGGAAVVCVRVLHWPARTTWIAIVAFVWCIGLTLWARYRYGHWRTLRVVRAEGEL
jgi:MATE family multidrug resistance protein